MPRPSKGEIWPKRLPRPGPLGSKVSNCLKSIMRPISGAIRTANTRDAHRIDLPAAGPVAGAGGPAGGGFASVLGPPAPAPPPELRNRADATSIASQIAAAPINQIKPGKL